MKMFVKNKWLEGFLDYYKSSQEYRIQTRGFINLEKLDDAYFIRPKSIIMVINYLREFGIIAVLRKIKSRLQEKFRNEKYVSCGIGIILETADDDKFAIGDLVAFIAPLHPALTERIVLPKELIIKINPSVILNIPNNIIAYKKIEKNQGSQIWWQKIRGWSIYSGEKLINENIDKILEKTKDCIINADWEKMEYFNIENPSAITEIREKIIDKKTDKKTAVLFGYGNYAKTQILPNIKKHINILAVHEIDPAQIYFEKKIKLDTSPIPRLKEKYGAFFIAGFHHTHAELAIQAINQNAYAVIEKPIVTEKKQLDDLTAAIQKNNGNIFSCFHKRYSPFNDLAVKDLNILNNDPISYHCIVHEQSQPLLYWYNWPNSKSPLLYNGCHWIDHFLFLNNFNKLKYYGAGSNSEKNTFNAWIELENGAFFTMTLSDKGSDYRGVQDYVELRTKKSTVKIINDSIYSSENKNGIIRKKTINKMDNYKLMYEKIAEKINRNEKGDTMESIKISAEIILFLEDLLTTNLKI